MRVWIDLANSPHSLLFAPIARSLEDEGATVLVTARDNAQTLALARRWEPDVLVIGGPTEKGRGKKASLILRRIYDLERWARAARPDVALSHNSYAQIAAARACGIPTVTAMDYEHQPANHLAFRLAHRVLLPRALSVVDLRHFGLTTGRTRYYDGLKEEVYLGDFVPDPQELRDAGIETSGCDVIVACRTPPSRAMYHRFGNELFEQSVAVAAREPNTRVVVLPRHDDQREAVAQLGLPNVTTPRTTIDGRSLLFHADLFIGAGGTMTREAALLGVPTLSAFAGSRPTVDRWLEEQGKLHVLRLPTDLLPLRKRTDKGASLDALRERGTELTRWFVRNVEEVQIRPTHRRRDHPSRQ